MLRARGPLLIAIWSLFGASAGAQTEFTPILWTPAGGSTAFDDAANWDPMIAPSGLTLARVYFPAGSTGTEAIRLNADAVSASLSVESGRAVDLQLAATLTLGTLLPTTGRSLVVGESSIPSELRLFDARTGGSTNTPMVSSVSLAIGHGAGSSGLLRLADAETKLEITGPAAVGAAGNGRLEIRPGSSVSIGGDLVLGDAPGSSGTIAIGEAGSNTLALLVHAGVAGSAADAVLGESGNAVLTLDGNAELRQTEFIGSVVLARQATSNASIMLRGPAALWTLESKGLLIGGFGTAEISLEGGARWDVTTGDPIQFVARPSSKVSVLVDGSQTVWSSTAGYLFEGPGLVSIYVSNEATVRGGMRIGDAAVISVDGTLDGTVQNFGELRAVGNRAASRISVTGNYIQQDSTRAGVLRTQIYEHQSVIAVTGLDTAQSATVGGSLHVVLAPGTTISNPSSLQGLAVLTADGGIDGQFTHATLPSLGVLGSYFRLRPSSNGREIQLEAVKLHSVLTSDLETMLKRAFYPNNLAFGKIDGDDLVDLIFTIPEDGVPGSTNGAVVILTNAGDDNTGNWLGFTGGTTIVTVGENPTALAVADLDRKHGTDIAVSSGTDGTISFLMNTGSGIVGVDRTVYFGANPVDIDLGGLDGDAFPEIIVACEDGSGGGQIVVAQNRGTQNGVWLGPEAPADRDTVATANRIYAIDCGDLDDDIYMTPDIVASLVNNSAQVFNNKGGFGSGWGGLELAHTLGVGEDPMSIELVYSSNDLLLDLVTRNVGNKTMSLYINKKGEPGFKDKLVVPFNIPFPY